MSLYDEDNQVTEQREEVLITFCLPSLSLQIVTFFFSSSQFHIFFSTASSNVYRTGVKVHLFVVRGSREARGRTLMEILLQERKKIPDDDASLNKSEEFEVNSRKQIVILVNRLSPTL